MGLHCGQKPEDGGNGGLFQAISSRRNNFSKDVSGGFAKAHRRYSET